jgi:hypothetical protein
MIESIFSFTTNKEDGTQTMTITLPVMIRVNTAQQDATIELDPNMIDWISN